ncbi:MAG: PilZ domain-containing protein [Planctomycetota bacterium]|jgi:hypothetical protein
MAGLDEDKSPDSAPDAASDSNARKTGRRRAMDLKCSLGDVLDVSKGGIRVMTRNQIPVNCEVRISFLSNASEPFSMLGRVAWVHKHGFRKFECGFEFVSPQPEHIALIRELAATHQPRTFG